MYRSSSLNIAIEMVALGAPDSWDQDEEIGRLKSMRRALLLLCAALTHSAPPSRCGGGHMQTSSSLNIAIEMVALGAPDSWDQDEEITRLKLMHRPLLLPYASSTHTALQCCSRAYFFKLPALS